MCAKTKQQRNMAEYMTVDVSTVTLTSNWNEKYTAQFYISDNLELYQNISIQFND